MKHARVGYAPDMNIFTRRNAMIGFLVLKALRRARRNSAVGYLAVQGVEHTRARGRGRRGLKISMYVALGVVSLGVLAALAGYAAKRKSSTAAGLDGAELAAPALDDAAETAAEEISDVAESASEPVSTT